MQISPALRPHHIFALRPQAQAQATLLSQESKPSTDEVRLGGVGNTAVLDQARAMVAASKAETLAAPESVKQIEELIARALQDPEAERQLIGLLQALNATGQLKPTLHQLTQAAVDSGAIPPMPEAKKNELIEMAAGMIDAQFRERGMTPDTQGVVYKDWDQLSVEHLSAVRNTQAPPRMAGAVSSFFNPTFVAELEALQGAKFRSGNSIKTLMDGPASFAERDRLMDRAKASIHMMSWAFYDDQTGWDTARKLVEKAQQGLDVKVMVDGQVSMKTKHDAPIRFLEDNGVEVVRWRDADRPYDGQHRKALIVDGQEAIVGGINIGDVYSHKYGDVKWRDADASVTGPAVTDSARLFGKIWNEQVEGTGKSVVELPAEPQPVSGGVRSAVVDHVPGPNGDAHILLATMKAIEGATESVDIENAYFINTPGMKDVLLKALADGVKVRLLTNSAESIDEPLITAPILASMPELIAAGAEVYLKKGDTLHSKFMTVDGVFSSIGSHNHHPRSQRFEGEMVINSLDPNLAQEFTHAFEADIAAATRITTPEQLQIPESPLGALAMRYFFDAL